MKTRNILMSGQNPRAILDDRKTQTRRIVKTQPSTVMGRPCFSDDVVKCSQGEHQWTTECPHGQPGDRLIVKENAWMWCEKVPDGKTKKTGRDKFRYRAIKGINPVYCADHPQRPEFIPSVHGVEWGANHVWRLKIGRFLPRWASRLTLELTDVRVERLNEISEADCYAEGIERPDAPNFGSDVVRRDNARSAYRTLWQSIHGPGTFDSRWVWALTFRKLEGGAP